MNCFNKEDYVKILRGKLDSRLARETEGPHLVVDQLYLGARWDARNINVLKEKEIGFILNLAEAPGYSMGFDELIHQKARADSTKN